MYRKLGPDTGYDAINDQDIAKPLCSFLDSLDRKMRCQNDLVFFKPAGQCRDFKPLRKLPGRPDTGEIQHGTAWWFNDTKDGMLEQMKSLANIGLLSRLSVC
ncbi:glucuronate isomerase [Bacillus licheniformis]|nr:glucuronate isomerase [Bacillus licheniformis]